MRLRTTSTALVLAAITLAGCSNGANDDPAATATATSATGAVSLDAGVAATVDGEEIAADRVDERVDRLVERAPAEEVEAIEPERLRDSLRAQVLTELVLSRIVQQGAEELGVEPSEEAVQELRDTLIEQAGGEEAFREQAQSAGYTPEQVDTQLHTVATLQAIDEQLREGDQGEPGAAAQRWLTERVAESDVAVDDEYGRWDAASGQVVPA